MKLQLGFVILVKYHMHHIRNDEYRQNRIIMGERNFKQPGLIIRVLRFIFEKFSRIECGQPHATEIILFLPY